MPNYRNTLSIAFNQHLCIAFVSMLIGTLVLNAQNAGTLVTARNGMVVSASAEASAIGVQILQDGGNAVDAAVATGFALAASYPSAGNLGGGAYIIIRMADGREAAIDAREVAPAASTRDMYLDRAGEVIEGLSLKGSLAAGVPGSVDGLLKAWQRYGTMERPAIIAPAIRLAHDGFPLHPRIANLFRIYHNEFSEFPSTLPVFTKQDGSPYEAGEIWKQPDLAETLQRISSRGREGFYSGMTADLIVAQMKAGGGIISQDDLMSYTSIVREPVRGMYRGHEVLSMPPSSSGGVVLIEMLNMLQQLPFDQYAKGSFEAAHLLVEVMKRAFADRAEYLGDPEYTHIPVDELVSIPYAKARAREIPLREATPAGTIRPELQQLREGTHTTHYSVIDRWGNAVSVTTTLNSSFGGKCVVEGAGFLLNNEMDDFSIKPGVPNQFGLVGNEANAIEPGKRMLSSMTPVIIVHNDTPVLITGSPGGSRIITTVLHVILNVLLYGMQIDEAIATHRYHHQWKPDEIQYESSVFNGETGAALRAAGHMLSNVPDFGRAEGIIVRNDTLYGSSDPRGYGAAIGY